MEELTILLVEDDHKTCKNFARYADELDDLLIVSITNNAAKALTDIQNFIPDVIILDLELHLGSGNGLEVLDGLNHLQIDIKPYKVSSTYVQKILYKNVQLFLFDIILYSIGITCYGYNV